VKELKEIAERLSLDVHVIDEVIQPSGDPAHCRLTLTTLRDLNSTIDRMFEELERLGKPELLERLCPYFGVIWPSARALALEVLQSEPCTVIEMGCGLAIPSLIAAQKGFKALATDFHPQVERFLGFNRTPNSAESLRYQEWDWQSGAPLGEIFDWVIGSDLLYDKELPKPLARTMAQALSPGGRITLTDPGRPYLQSFCDEMTQNLGFNCSTKIVSVPHLPKKNQEIFVLDFIKKI
jgi:predicted nicotinamide N-methyase